MQMKLVKCRRINTRNNGCFILLNVYLYKELLLNDKYDRMSHKCSATIKNAIYGTKIT
jgi:hypothetical protein